MAIPVIWLTFAVSILIHVGVLLIWIPRTPLFAHRGQEEDQTIERLQVRLATQATPTPPAPAPESRPEAPALTQLPRTPPPRTPPPRPRVQAPPVIALPSPPPSVVPLPAPAAPAPAPPRVSPPMEGDLAAYIEAKRRARGDREGAQDDDKAQVNRNIAANLPAPARGVAAQETRRGGGIFEIKRMAYDDAAFEFFGWNTTMGRRTPQLIEVRRGDNSDMRIAVVRKMIAIIRQFEKEDFVWESPRRDRKFVLSARLSDNAALEDFLMHEFFDDARYSK